MYNTDTELLFPSRIITELRDQRGASWQKLVDRILDQDPTSIERLAFVLMIARLDGCTTCNADSFRAMRGCTQCALQNVRRFRGKDRELVKMFNEARKDIELYINNKDD